MSNKSPVFPMPDIQQHLSDYGFHPHFDYFQMLEEARKQKRESPRGRFKQKKKHNNNRNSWWKHALHFFKGKLTPHQHSKDHHHHPVHPNPVYITESRSGSSRPMSGSLSPVMSGEIGNNIPYMSLRDINNQISATSLMPIYLVT